MSRRVAAYTTLFVLAAAVAPTAAAIITTHPFLGIKHHTITETTPRRNVVNVVEIDLTVDGIRLMNTPGNGAAAGETNVETTSAYVSRVGAQVGINTTFFNLGGTPNDNIGLLTSNGELISPNDASKPAVLNISQANVATVTNAGAAGTYTAGASVSIYNAVAGSDRIIRNGVNSSPADSNVAGAFLNLNPRTAAGVTQDNKTLFLLTVDGRRAGYSDGMYLREVADMLLSFGAYNALNLDGGGSTTLAMDFSYDGQGTQVVNRPSGGAQRQVGANLAVFALPVGPPPPPPPPNIKLLETFTSSEGHFSGTFTSGSNRGINSAAGQSSLDHVAAGGMFDNGGHQRINVVANTADTFTGFELRNLSGGGSPASNDPFTLEGYVGFFLKTSTPDLQVAIVVDEEGTARTERGSLRNVIADGEWHLYEWAITDANDWENFNAGDGTLNAAYLTIDSIFLKSAVEQNALVYLDHVVQNTTGSLAVLVPEPTSVTCAAGVALATLRRWRR